MKSLSLWLFARQPGRVLQKKTKCPAVRKFSNFLKIPFLIVGKYSIFYLLECEL